MSHQEQATERRAQLERAGNTLAASLEAAAEHLPEFLHRALQLDSLGGADRGALRRVLRRIAEGLHLTVAQASPPRLAVLTYFDLEGGSTGYGIALFGEMEPAAVYLDAVDMAELRARLSGAADGTEQLELLHWLDRAEPGARVELLLSRVTIPVAAAALVRLFREG